MMTYQIVVLEEGCKGQHAAPLLPATREPKWCSPFSCGNAARGRVETKRNVPSRKSS
jgi:hypothetical protein